MPKVWAIQPMRCRLYAGQTSITSEVADELRRHLGPREQDAPQDRVALVLAGSGSARDVASYATRLRADGKSLKTIADSLNRAHIARADGTPGAWQESSVAALLEPWG